MTSTPKPIALDGDALTERLRALKETLPPGNSYGRKTVDLALSALTPARERTEPVGYISSDGFEILIPDDRAARFKAAWDALPRNGIGNAALPFYLDVPAPTVIDEGMVDRALAAKPQNSPVAYFLNPDGYLSTAAVRELMHAALLAAFTVGAQE